MTGKVYLVGAGPGDPGLLTLRGAELLGRAQTVVYDQLAAPELLSLAPPGCRLVDAGKKAGDHALSQAAINELLAQEALAGRTVIRLKGGDPYIFGRGGEEALYLAERGLEFETIPGVSSAIAAAAAAGVPLTHRGLSQLAILATGHAQNGRDGVDFASLPDGTVAVVMGRANLKSICQGLIKSGRPPQTPAAAVERGATARQKTVVGTLADLPLLADRARLAPPTLLVAGAVVSLRDRLGWFEKRPLFGRTVLVTRARAQAGRLSAIFRELGARVIEAPAIAVRPIEPNPELDQALEDLTGSRLFGYLVLTSPNGAEIFLKALFKGPGDARALFGLKIVAIGPGTAAALTPFGLKADGLPKVYQAEGL
ncbi:MAG: uroporphyrinogen-III C-methyltransferase, partial [Deltaproteobacteria bacterium]|nr:uroporphyrinogen-III C-methyltransferase [Deltaproteobacteria bacterium]